MIFCGKGKMLMFIMKFQRHQAKAKYRAYSVQEGQEESNIF